jgi:hypothetical protein
MKTSIWTCILFAIFLVGCGGGGGNPGTCSGSPIYCAEAAGAGGAATPGTTGGGSTDLFTKSGSGDTVFDIPARVTRIRIQGTFTGASSTFFVDIAGKSVVIETLGTSWNSVAFDGTYLLTGGGTVEIKSSSGVSWTFTEVAVDNSPAPAGLFTKSGSGDTVFDIPARVTRIRIQGTFTGVSSNFFVDIAGKSVVIETIGTSQNPVAFDATYLLTGGGTVEITSSSGVAWTFTEVAADNSPAPAGLFTKSGSGDTVFDIPARVTRIRIQGTFTGASSNFFVDIAGKSVVIETIGTSQNPVALDGTYLLTGGGTAEITSSSGVSWTFTEVQ